MSITRQDVRDLIGQKPGQAQLREEEIDRMVRVLNAHRGPARTSGDTTVRTEAGSRIPATPISVGSAGTLVPAVARPANAERRASP